MENKQRGKMSIEEGRYLPSGAQILLPDGVVPSLADLNFIFSNDSLEKGVIWRAWKMLN